MSKKTNTVAARLAQRMKPVYPFAGDEPDWNSPEIWTAAARKALDAADLDGAIRIAFEKFNLDPRNPHHWRLLLGYFCQAHFEHALLKEKKKAGAPRLWSDKDLCRLAADFYQVKSRNPSKSKSSVCHLMKKDKSVGNRNWKRSSVETIRRNINRALSPKCNLSLRLIDRIVKRALRANSSREDEAMVRSRVFEAVSDIL